MILMLVVFALGWGAGMALDSMVFQGRCSKFVSALILLPVFVAAVWVESMVSDGSHGSRLAAGFVVAMFFGLQKSTDDPGATGSESSIDDYEEQFELLRSKPDALAELLELASKEEGVGFDQFRHKVQRQLRS